MINTETVPPWPFDPAEAATIEAINRLREVQAQQLQAMRDAPPAPVRVGAAFFQSGTSPFGWSRAEQYESDESRARGLTAASKDGEH